MLLGLRFHFYFAMMSNGIFVKSFLDRIKEITMLIGFIFSLIEQRSRGNSRGQRSKSLSIRSAKEALNVYQKM